MTFNGAPHVPHRKRMAASRSPASDLLSGAIDIGMATTKRLPHQITWVMKENVE
ncbi:hypothetical protein OK016_22015 [Vibrio chagasii]|nr:hypothetical protein [Vibrio chagasii]